MEDLTGGVRDSGLQKSVKKRISESQVEPKDVELLIELHKMGSG